MALAKTVTRSVRDGVRHVLLRTCRWASTRTTPHLTECTSGIFADLSLSLHRFGSQLSVLHADGVRIGYFYVLIAEPPLPLAPPKCALCSTRDGVRVRYFDVFIAAPPTLLAPATCAPRSAGDGVRVKYFDVLIAEPPTAFVPVKSGQVLLRICR